MFGKFGDMKKKAEEMKERLAEARLDGEAGGIKVTCDGTKNLVSIDIPDLYLDASRKEEVEEKIKEAINTAGKKADELMKNEMSSLAGPLSGMLGL